MDDEKTPDEQRQDASQEDVADRERRGERPGHSWADEAAKARTSDDPRARTPRDAVGQPSTRSLEDT